MKKQTLVSLAAGSVLAAAALTPAHAAQGNPFEAQPLQAGYQLAQAGDKKTEASCGGKKKVEASCGADKKAADKMAGEKKVEASCGGKK